MNKQPTPLNLPLLRMTKYTLNKTSNLCEGSRKSSNNPTFVVNICDDRTVYPLQFETDSEDEKLKWVLKINQIVVMTQYFDNFEKVSILGKGGQGIVYKMRNKQTNEVFALKEAEIKDERQMKSAMSEALTLKKVIYIYIYV